MAEIRTGVKINRKNYVVAVMGQMERIYKTTAAARRWLREMGATQIKISAVNY